ncbi:MAG: UDP-N-acetylglucosamine--N-acetylmuramyl-(pentapeptide) pyrophosphoryl-undecaprenol N-acetylglucosamine transferase, partial [Candidatus Limnocylindrales bacterium]
MRLLIAGGGTGGHIYPALAVARSLLARAGTPELGWLGGHRGLERSIVPAAGIGLTRLVLRSLRSAARDVHLVLDPVRLGMSIPQAFVLLLVRRPAAIFTTGGYVAIPTLLAATVLRIPSVLWEGNVVPGRSVRFVASRATVVAVSHAETATALGHPRSYVTGTPIRALDGIDVDDARARFGGRPGERILLVFGGSQAVRRINDAVMAALPRLVERVRVVHVTGEDGYAAAIATRESLPVELRDRYRPFPFLHEDMTAALAAADLAVGRAGASTLAEAAAFALPMAIVPYPHASG